MFKKIILACAIISVVSVCNAEVIDIPLDYTTIQEGINASVNGDTVLVQPGTYVENVNFYGKNITLGSLYLTTQDTSYISQTIIDGDSSGTVVSIYSSEDSTIVLTGFTITNGCTSWGGGIHCGNSNLRIMYVIIKNNSTNTSNAAGGGICCGSSNVILENVKISGNVSGYGGGLFCHGNSSLRLTNVIICNNKATEGWCYGGGIACKDSSYLYLENVSIYGNSASGGGGILMTNNSTVDFDDDNRCNIYSNYAGFGSDIYSNQPINVIVDTFSVIDPTSFHVNPIENFTFDILHGINIQVNSDLFVSPDGDNSNSGLSWSDPLKTVAYAMSIIKADSSNPHTVNLSSGIFSQNTNSEQFPLPCISYVSLNGSGENETILDGDHETTVLYLCRSQGVEIEGITVKNGYSDFKGGGVYCYASDPIMKYVKISENSTNRDGAGVYCVHSSPTLQNVTISDNFTTGNLSEGGGIYCSHSSPNLANVTISDNTAATGGGISCYGDTSPSLVNSVLWNNSPNEIYLDDFGQSSITIAYSDVQGGLDSIVTNNNTVNWLDGNIDADPLFVDPTNGDYHLSWTNYPVHDYTMSPCIDAGDPNSPLDPDSTIADMGAYYFHQTLGTGPELEIHELSLKNYPNPFQSSTTISFSVPKATKVGLQIYNVKGQLVEEILKGDLQSGEGTIEWNSEDYPSGVYFYKLSTPQTSSVNKMVIMK